MVTVETASWKGAYINSTTHTRYFAGYCTYTTSQTATTFTVSVSAIGFKKISTDTAEFVEGSSKKASLTASGASVKSGNPISKSYSPSLKFSKEANVYRSIGSGTIVFNKTASTQTATLTLYAAKSGGDISAAWGGKASKSFSVTIPPITRTITYSKNGGSGIPANTTAINGATYTLPTTKPTRDEYDFVGWSDGTNVYQPGATYKISDNVTFTAQWRLSFIPPQINNLNAYRVSSTTSDVAVSDGIYGYTCFDYTPPENVCSQNVTVYFSTDDAPIPGTPISGFNSFHGTNEIPLTSSATVTVTISGEKNNGESYSISDTTYISPEITVWDAYVDDSNTISSFAIGGMANEVETRFDCYMPPFFHTMVGEIKMWAGNTIPDGWLLCDGAEVSKTTYPNLYEAIGDLWGTPASSSNFMLPNLNGKVPVGYNSTDTDFDAVGKMGGEKTHTLSDTEMPSHNHGGNGTGKRLLQYNYSETDGVSERSVASASGNYKAPVVNDANTDWADTDYTGNTGGGGAHNNLQPYAVIKYIICAI